MLWHDRSLQVVLNAVAVAVFTMGMVLNIILHKMYELKDYLKAINETKENLLDTNDITWEKKYPPYVINRCMSMFYDTVMHSNEMNGLHFLPKRMQFHFFINSIRKKRRFGGKWLSQTKLKNLALIKEYYGYSNSKAKEALNILSKNQIENIKIELIKGGRKLK